MRKLRKIIIDKIIRLFPDFPDHFRKYLVNRLMWEKLRLVNGKIMVNSYFPLIPSRALKSVVRAWHYAMEGITLPEIVTIAVSNICPYNCVYCSVPDKTVCDLPTPLLIQTIHSLQEMGTYHFSLTGGEPLLRRDLTDIISSIDHRSTVKMFTTGYSLSKEKAKALKKAGLFSLNISLDNTDPHKHDEQCRYNGAFDIALRAIKYSKAASLFTCVTTIATRERIHSGEIFRFLEFMKKLGIDEVTIFEPLPAGKLSFCDNMVLREDERNLLKTLHKQGNSPQEKGFPKVLSLPYIESAEYMGCGAGCTRLHITALGEVMPCDFTSITFGNIQEEDIETIWEKMHGFFKRPSKDCFVMENYKLLRKLHHGSSQMIDYYSLTKNIDLTGRDELPEFYNNLMT
ncbi:MAG: radical SAM protein [Thermovirga sp.]|nr:radical SAM protein [Thermovirga sp.]